MRLIDTDAINAEEIIAKFPTFKGGGIISPIKEVIGSVVCEIQMMPTAYDVDKVLEELESLNPVDYGSMFSYEGHSCAREMKRDAIDIVKRGGVDEGN